MSHFGHGISSSVVPFLSAATPRPPRIALVNIMDNAAGTERHFLRTLSTAAPDATITLCRMACAKKDPKYFIESDHLLSSRYIDWQTALDQNDFDLVIVTGINRGTLSYDDLARDYSDFWNESCDLFRTLQQRVRTGRVGNAALVCWSAFAAMKELYGVEKGIHPQKFYGLFPHTIETPSHPLVSGFGKNVIHVPQSRSSFMAESALRHVINEHQGDVVMNGPDGPAVWTLEDGRITCFINHLEYEMATLQREYLRDSDNGKKAFPKPQNYAPDDPHLPAIFDRLGNACAAFYCNLVRLAQQQKAAVPLFANDARHPPAPILAQRQLASGL